MLVRVQLVRVQEVVSAAATASNGVVLFVPTIATFSEGDLICVHHVIRQMQVVAMGSGVVLK